MIIALMMEAARTSETWVHVYLTTRQYIPVDSELRRRENLKSHKKLDLIGETIKQNHFKINLTSWVYHFQAFWLKYFADYRLNSLPTW
jgi:hypothetical protein